MFDGLSKNLINAVKGFAGKKLTESNIQEGLEMVRVALLEADVSVSVVDDFLNAVRRKAVGKAIEGGVAPGQFVVKVVHDELLRVMGEQCETLNLRVRPPAVILVAGLQGAGKTTTVAKLGRWLAKNEKKKVMVTSADVYRPAAIEQLAVLAEQAGLDYYPSTAAQKPVKIAKAAIAQAKKQFADVLIIDTAGRMHIDKDMMAEIAKLHNVADPIETLFVVDSMTGQDATNTAKHFNEVLPLTGVILTKTDGDARGGAALSIRHVTGKPIKFMGVGEKIEALEPFYPDRLTSRILGMGDILSLVEQAQEKVDHDKAEKLAKKFKQGKQFTLDDFLVQLEQMRAMGGAASLMGKMPGFGALPESAKSKVDDKMFEQMEVIIRSMTVKERHFPDLVRSSGSRKRRIAKGSGRPLPDINRLLSQFDKMQKMMKKLRSPKMAKLMSKMGGMGGGMPPGGMPF